MLEFSVFHRIIVLYIDFTCCFYIFKSQKQANDNIHCPGRLRKSLHKSET